MELLRYKKNLPPLKAPQRRATWWALAASRMPASCWRLATPVTAWLRAKLTGLQGSPLSQKTLRQGGQPASLLRAALGTLRPTPRARLITLSKGHIIDKAQIRPLLRTKEDAVFHLLLLRFIESWLGVSARLILDRNALQRVATVKPASLVSYEMLSLRISQHVPNSKALGLGLWSRCAEASFAAAKLQEPTLLIKWLEARLQRMSPFGHRRFFRLFGIFLTTLLGSRHPAFHGVSLYIVGKISVTGNAMSRAQFVRAGVGGNANLRVQAAPTFTLVRTNTGCLGLTLTFFYAS